MANEIREEKNIGIIEPETGKEDVISLFADDSAGIVNDVKTNLRVLRSIIKKYEDATASKLHDTKTQVLMLGKMKTKEIKNDEVGVEFNIMTEKDKERYLGDLVGHRITEEIRFEGAIEKMENTAKTWTKLNTKVYGKAIIANSMMLAQILYRGQVNVVSDELRTKAKKVILDFMKGEQRQFKWEKLLLPIESGGVNLRDPAAALDTQMIRLLKLMIVKADQPWVKWLKRREEKLKRKWGFTKSLLRYAPTEEQREELRELAKTSLYENALEIWYKFGGSSLVREEMERKLGCSRERTNYLIDEYIEEEKDQVGMYQVGRYQKDDWCPLVNITSKQIYSIIISKMYVFGNQKGCNAMRKEIRNFLTAEEQNFWFNIHHGRIQARAELSKWAKDEKGKPVSEKCGLCKTKRDVRRHKFYECRIMQEFIKKVEQVYNSIKGEKEQEWRKPTYEQWQLEAETFEPNKEKMTVVIAKARYLYQIESEKVYKRRKRKLDTNIVIERLKKAMRSTKMT